MSPEEIAADIVVSDPEMLADALYHTEQLNRHEDGEGSHED